MTLTELLIYLINLNKKSMKIKQQYLLRNLTSHHNNETNWMLKQKAIEQGPKWPGTHSIASAIADVHGL